ncbi:MAG: bifunctional 5,10-methylene-tetrahydrofolate dehydrogenase/5,10-methylene-tetrahydrofolate cyclohydrolase [Deltaproteobacteria bacterium]|nr:bifunctional 5,10-methylene-tetrahydrofolate dehydrogenase/5,10-methylene-tetrahydrofolate cyclohydrolase [Deltaproteobacteria bacterium]
MSAKIISGNEVSKQLKDEMKEEVVKLKAQGLEPCLSVILVGEDPASKVYVLNKKKACEYIGIKSLETRLPATTTTEELLKVIEGYNNDKTVHGILCQLPLPKHIPEAKILRSILPEKDVDCFHPFNVGLISIGEVRFLPCTPAGVIELIKRGGFETAGKDVVILGRSNIVGRPLSNMLDQRDMNATVTMCHTKTKNLKERCAAADIVIGAIGRPEYVKADMVREGAVVIDVGINRVDAPGTEKGFKLVGDVAFDEVKEKAAAITPVPGGVGPMTIAMLMKNTLTAAKEAFFKK